MHMRMAAAEGSSTEVPGEGRDARRLDHVEVFRFADPTDGARETIYPQSATSWECLPADTATHRYPPTWLTVIATPHRTTDLETVAVHPKMVGAPQRYPPPFPHDNRDDMTTSQQIGTIVEAPLHNVANQMAAATPLRDDFDFAPSAAGTSQEEACVACETVHRYIEHQGEHFVTHDEAIILGRIYERIRQG